jgi:predicted dehydrogenase
MPSPIRIGIVGTGGMARYHAEQFKSIAGVRLEACLDVVREKAEAYQEATGTRVVAKDLPELLSLVDAVAVVTPDRFHAEPTIAALKAGKHVMCEKPLTVTLDEAVEVAARAREAARKGAVHMVNFSYRRSAAFQRGIELQRAKALGKLRHVHSYYLQSVLAQAAWGLWTTDSNLWRLQTAKGSGGVLGDLGCHILDLTTAVAGEVRALRCHLATFPKILDGKEYTQWQGAKLDANDTAMIEIDFEGGGTGLVHTSRWAVGHLNHLRCEVHGTKGAMRFDLDQDYDAIELYQARDLKKASWKAKKLKATPSNWQRFIRSIKSGKNDQPDILRGAQVQAYLDACVRSAASGRWESVSAVAAAKA